MEQTIVNRCRDWTPRFRWVWQVVFLGAVFLLGNRAAWSQDDARSRTREASRGLALPSRSNRSESELSNGKTVSVSTGLWNTTISLGLIVGTLILAGRWIKRKGFGGAQSLPVEAFEILGRRVLEPKVSVHLVKCGTRVLLLGVGADGVRTLSEIDDPAEVQQLTALCQPSLKNEVTSTTSGLTTTSNVSQSATGFRRTFTGLIAIGLWLSAVSPLSAQSSRPNPTSRGVREQVENGQGNGRQRAVQQAAFEQPQAASQGASFDPQQLVSPQQLGLSIKMLALMTVFSLAPSILMMTTSFVRFTVVLGLLRQALGTQQGPPNQVLTAICLFLTILVMSPVWQRSYQEGIRPYTNPAPGESAMDESLALSRALAPIRDFMSQQIDKAGNADAVWMLLDFQQSSSGTAVSQNGQEPQSYDDVPFTVLAPAYLLSELKVGFLIGFQLFLPFLIIDLVVATTLASLGLNMLPPSMVSLPLKLVLFVLIDGWFLTIGMLLESVKLV